ncbi:MAG: hypothetical protein L6R36_002795 [Xanthoria steineri]|nr:MAG: hypothetical protein L6R36_002795 [Xanthoria steineri]
MEGTPEPSGGSERPRSQWTVQQIKKALDIKSLEQYHILYTDLERVMDENGLLGANFGVIKNKTALQDLFPAMVHGHCSEHSTASSGSIKKALLHLAHKINTNAIKKANREKSLKPRPLRRKKTGSGPLLEASTRPSQEGSIGLKTTCQEHSSKLNGEEIITIQRDDGTVAQKCRLKMFCRKKASGKIILEDVSRDMLIAYLVREKIMSSLHEPVELLHHSTVDGVYPCHNEEFFRSVVSEDVMNAYTIDSDVSPTLKHQNLVDRVRFLLRLPCAIGTSRF